MARKVKTAVVEAVTVNPEKIVRGLTTVFQGFSIMFDGMAEQMQLMQGMTGQLSVPEITQSKEAKNKGEVSEDSLSSGTNEEPEKEELPWDTKPKAESKEASAVQQKEASSSTITADDIREVVVTKIKQNRKNNEQIGKLLSAYGVKLLSDLPEEKYESFLNDISQL